MKLLITTLICTSILLTACSEQASTQETSASDTAEMTSAVASQDTTETNTSQQYVDYSESDFEAAKDKRGIIFFHASWCPTCKAANTDIIKNINKLPADVVIFKTDYDTEKELKDKYVITYQHTFVLVDAEGNEIRKWNGGMMDEILEKI